MADVAPIQPFSSVTSTVDPGLDQSSITRVQTPLHVLPAYSLTLMKCQGQNVEHSLVDPTTPPGGAGNRLTLNEPCVDCSRSSGRPTIRFLRRMPDTLARLLQTYIPQYVRTDDARLRAQAADTRRAFLHDCLETRNALSDPWVPDGEKEEFGC